MPRGKSKTVPVVQSPVQQPVPVEAEDSFSGLYLFGQVIDRTRRTINTRNNNSTAEIVTYTIQDINGRRYYVDEYSPEEYYEISEYAEIPVFVKTYKKRTGEIGYSFCVQTENEFTRGEHF